MKKIILLAAIALATISCKKEIKKETTDVTKEAIEVPAKETYLVTSEGTDIYWTAYKTTAKTPVKGQFTKINLKNAKATENPIDAFNGLEFSIPVSSIFSKNEDRDSKLQKFFFGVMDNTELLSGTFKINADKKCVINFTMNNTTFDLPLTYKIEGRTVIFNGLMQLKDWNALDAVASINKACFDLHKGEDGVSKTWEEVAIDATVYLKK